jgi:hypothetical protein
VARVARRIPPARCHRAHTSPVASTTLSATVSQAPIDERDERLKASPDSAFCDTQSDCEVIGRGTVREQ